MKLKVFTTRKDRMQAAAAFEHFLSCQEAEIDRQIDAEISRLKSPEDVKRWQRHVRRGLADILGDFPKRTPLNPRVVGSLERPGIVVEKVIFESQPRYYVTANLYIPEDWPLPAPGVLVPCGHAARGKGFRLYRDTGIALARKGYVALVYDPTGQGERSECFNPRTHKHIVRREVSQHHWTGKPCFLTGMTLAGYRTWDGIRALDYLCSRREVDASRIGVMGNSGGGAMTLLITAVDERVKACAASHPGGSMENTHLRGRRPPDRRLYSLIAPRPCRIIVGDKSGEEPRHRVKLEIMKPFFRACGCPERLELVVVDGKHDLRRPKREASYQWFNRWLGRQGEPTEEPEFRTISERALWCTRGGQVEPDLKGNSMFSLNRARARKLASRRALPGTKAALRRQLSKLSRKVEGRIGFRHLSTPLNARTVGVGRITGGIMERLVFESEPGVPIPSLLLLPTGSRPDLPVVIHTSEGGKPDVLKPVTLPVRLYQLGFPVLSIDVRDTGETSCCKEIPGRKWRDFNDCRWRHDLLAIRALALGRSRAAMRVLDVIRAVDFVQERPNLRGREAVVVGEGRGAIWALKAAGFDARVKAVAAVRMLASYKLITENRYYNQFQHFWVPGALLDYDVADLPALAAPRPVWILDPIDHMSRRLSEASARRLLDYGRRVYKMLGRPRGLLVARTAGSVVSVARRVAELVGTMQ